MEIKERVLGFCQCSGQDLLLSKQHYDEKKKSSWYEKWVKASEWNWNNEPTDRQIMDNEIVLETDYDMETNKRLTRLFQNKLREFGVMYYTYFTGSKSFHIHFFVKDIQKYTHTHMGKSIKFEIAKEVAGENFKFVDKQNFIDKKLIRIEGSIHPKTKRKGTLFDKFNGKQYEISEVLLAKALPKQLAIAQTEKFGNKNKFYCYVIEEAMKIKFPEGNRHMCLCPNACAILTKPEFDILCKAQQMDANNEWKWKLKDPMFRCLQLRKYAKDIGKQNLCKQCIRDGNFKEDY